MSIVISWFDLKGRFRTKQYLYPRCAEKFADSLVRSGAFIGRVRFDTYDLDKHTGHFISKVGRS